MSVSHTSQAQPTSPSSLQPFPSKPLNGHNPPRPPSPRHSPPPAPTPPLSTSFHIAPRLRNFVAPTVWHEFTPLAASTKAMNLGQGFPGFSPPDFVKEAAANAVTERSGDFLLSQYARPAGHLPLVRTLAAFYEPRLGRPIDPLTEVLVTVGASEALCAIMLGLLREGDEVVMLEPAFDIYIAQAEMCGATIRYVPLRTRPSSSTAGAEEWYLDMAEFAAAFDRNPRLFILNTPHNPSGKVFTTAELTAIGEVCAKGDTVILSDEVYEHMVYAPHRHVPIASLPGMWERTLTVSSSGKTFSVTGWKIGWVLGPDHLTRCAAIAHSWLSFSTCTPLQHAVAEMHARAAQPFEEHPTYFDYLTATYTRRRATLMDALTAAGLSPIEPEGGFFIVADTSRVDIPKRWDDGSVTRDWAFCRWLCNDIGVCAIPPSAFYGDEDRHLAGNLARFAFCKSDEVLAEAGKRLLKLKEFTKKQ